VAVVVGWTLDDRSPDVIARGTSPGLRPRDIPSVGDVTRSVKKHRSVYDPGAGGRADGGTGMDVGDVPVGVVEVDRQGRVVAENLAARELLGAVRHLVDAVDEDDRERLLGHLEHVRTSAPDQRAHLELVLAGTPTLLTSAPGRDGTVVCALTEVSELDRRLEELERRAFTDGLTGLANRSLLLQMLDQVLRGAERSKAPTALLFIDVDNFKAVNDTHGHVVGDAVLVEVARRLRSAVRPTDLVARVGGDEFVVLAPEVDEADAQEVARRVLALCSAPLTVGGLTMEVSVSIGVAIEDPGAEPQRALAKADTAMYAAKAAGRATTMTWTPTLNEGTALGATSDVAAALERVNRELLTRIQQLRLEARSDTRTGLLSERAYEDMVRTLAGAGVEFTVLFADIDLFHGYNERYTHIRGHEALARVAAALRDVVGGNGTVFRYGGEEFTAVCPRTELAVPEAEELARLVPAHVEALGLPYEGSPFGCVTVSVGVAHTEQGGDVTSAANLAMLDAKRRGRNRATVYKAQP
jgi:diguanylate cyclase (GGDEF)-like protein